MEDRNGFGQGSGKQIRKRQHTHQPKVSLTIFYEPNTLRRFGRLQSEIQKFEV